MTSTKAELVAIAQADRDRAAYAVQVFDGAEMDRDKATGLLSIMERRLLVIKAT